MAPRHRIHGLYVIIDPDACRDRSPIDIARDALSGGAKVLQWRDKRRDKGEQIADARAIAQLCTDRGALLIINDHADLVAATGAHGVHLGQHDLPLATARAVVGTDVIIGVSTNSAAEAAAAEAGGADYVAVGAIFPTSSKADTRPADLDRIRDVKTAVHVPVIAIGGINAGNITDVIAAGADAVAVISAVCGAADVVGAAATLASAFAARGVSQRRTELRAIIDSFVDTLNRRDRAGFIALFAADGIIQDPIDEPPHIGHDGIGAWWDGLIDRQNNYEVRLDSSHITGEEAAITWTISHQHEGEVHHARGVEILSFDGDLIASCHSYWSRDETSQAATQHLVDDFVRTLNDRDKSAYLALFADEAIQQEPVGTTPRIGLGAISAWWDTRMSVYSSYRLSADLVCGAGVEAAVAWNIATEVDGATFVADGVDVLTIDDTGRIASVHSYWELDEPWPPSAKVGATDSSYLQLVAQRFIDVLNNRDRDGFMDLFVPDCVVQVPQHAEPFVGREGLQSWWDATIPGRPFHIRLDGAHATRSEVALVWTNVDETPGSTTSLRGIEILMVEGDRLSSVSSYRTRGAEADPRPRAVANAFAEALNARDREAFLALWAKDGMRQDPPDMIPIIGIHAIGRAFDEMLIQFPDYTMGIETVCVAGNEAAIAWRTENRAGNIRPVVEGVVLIALDAEGKIASLHAYWQA